MIFLNLLNNIALLVTLSAVHSMMMRRWRRGGTTFRIISGVLFGAVAIVGMATPLRILPGIIFDGRSIVISIGGLFGGPVVGVVAAAIAASYRLWLGGAGTLMGVSVITESACIGVAYYYLRRWRPPLSTPWHLLGFGLVVHVGMLFLTVTLPGGVSTAVLQQIALPVLTIYPVGTLLICMLFLNQESRLQAETALRESEERYRSLFEAANDAIFLMADDRFVDCNPGTLAIFGCNRAQILQARPSQFSPEFQPDGRRSAEKAGEKISAAYNGAAQFFEWRHGRLDGEVFEAEVGLSRVSIAGRPHLLAIVRDVTERKRAEQALGESEKRFRQLVKLAPIPLCFVAKEGALGYVNDRFVQVFGYTQDDVPTLTEWWKRAYPDEDCRRRTIATWAAAVRRAAETGADIGPIEYNVACKNGVVRVVEISGITIGDSLLATFVDLTARKQAEAEIRKLNTELEERVRARTAQLELANQELEAFSYSVSHDLRAPLRAMDGFARILLENYAPDLDPKAAHYLRRVHENARQMGQLVDDLLAFSRLTRQPLQLQRVCPVDLVREVLADLSAEQQGRSIELEIAELPACQADRNLLKQVFANLLSNAIKYTRGRSPCRIEVGTFRSGDEQVYLVRDNGVGFDMRYADKLFGVFQRLHRAEEFEGTGVGLATVQRIIHRHGGRVWAEAEPEQGATFYFSLKGGLDNGSRAG